MGDLVSRLYTMQFRVPEVELPRMKTVVVDDVAKRNGHPSLVYA